MEAYSRESRAGEPLQTESDTVMGKLADCAMTISVLIALLIVPALLAHAILWLFSGAMDLTNIIPFPR